MTIISKLILKHLMWLCSYIFFHCFCSRLQFSCINPQDWISIGRFSNKNINVSSVGWTKRFPLLFSVFFLILKLYFNFIQEYLAAEFAMKRMNFEPFKEFCKKIFPEIKGNVTGWGEVEKNVKDRFRSLRVFVLGLLNDINSGLLHDLFTYDNYI